MKRFKGLVICFRFNVFIKLGRVELFSEVYLFLFLKIVYIVWGKVVSFLCDFLIGMKRKIIFRKILLYLMCVF